jgi:DNA-directed RNA polymerase specialized sigma24 family protein
MEQTLTPSSFQNLLLRLDPTGQDPGRRYEDIRRRLIKFFEWNGCHGAAEDLADTTFDRVTRLLDDGREITSKDIFGFIQGVGRNIAREYKGKIRPVSLEQLPSWNLPRDPTDSDHEIDNEQLFQCFEKCAARLSETDRKLIIEYYVGDKSAKIENRRKLAENLKISPNALRIRAHRIREELESCVGRCVGGSGEKDFHEQ